MEKISFGIYRVIDAAHCLKLSCAASWKRRVKRKSPRDELAAPPAGRALASPETSSVHTFSPSRLGQISGGSSLSALYAVKGCSSLDK